MIEEVYAQPAGSPMVATKGGHHRTGLGGHSDHAALPHDQRVRLGEAQLLLVEAEETEILARRGHEAAAHSLALQA